MTKLLLILDIDETLVYSSETILDREEDLKVEPYYTYKRPHLSKFIEYALENYLVAIWSSSSKSYCDDRIPLKTHWILRGGRDGIQKAWRGDEFC